VQRAIVGFDQDDEGDWVAELVCGHRQHVRHRPPFFPHPWVLEPEGREERIGTPLECRLCDQGGEAACFAHLVCPECGVVLDGGPHRPGCPSASRG
jgi:hypothetical protein